MKHRNPRPECTTQTLRRGDVARVPRARQLCLRSERGTLWVTADGRNEDFQLDAGASLVFDGRAQLVVSALGGDAAFCVIPLQTGPRWPRRVLHWLGWPARAAVA